MYRTMFCRRNPASRRLRMLAAAAMAALALSACGGGGGGGSGNSGGGATEVLGRSPSAGGVKAYLTHDGTNQGITIAKDGRWSHPPSTVQPAPAGWVAATKQNKPGDAATELFRAVGKIADADDEDYLLYGYWNRLPLTQLSDYKPFYYGKTPYAGKVVEQTGDATYTGGATGVYRTDTTTAVAGRFTADVTITATFDVGDAKSASLRFGMSNIATLTSAGAAGPSLDDTSATALNARTTGSSFTGTGANSGSRWAGQFYGPSGGVPTGIAGWFEGVLASGTVSGYGLLTGTFGAKKQ